MSRNGAEAMSTTTLVEELEQAADLAEHCAVDGGEFADGDKRLAARLRARAEHVRRMQETIQDGSATEGEDLEVVDAVKDTLRVLTGPGIGQPQEGGEK